MSTSGTVTFRTNRNEIILGALRSLNAYDIENSAGPTTAQINMGAQMLNLLVKSWESKGLQLWERRYGVIFPQPDQGVFVLGSPGPAGDHATLTTPLGVGGYVQTTLASAAASGATSIVVSAVSTTATAGVAAVSISDTYNIGIERNSGAVQWTTVSGAPSGTTVTLAAGLSGAAASGNNVFCYQTKLVRPLRITDGFIRNTATGNDTPCQIIPREHYNRFGLKTASGVPTQLYYDPQSNAGHLYLYPVFDTPDQLLYIEFQKPIEDFAASSDDYDLPQEWGLALKTNLAYWLAPEYEVSREKFNQVKEQASVMLTMISGWDQEDASVFIQP